MASITSAADWAIGILLSLIGWGWLLASLLRLPRVTHWGEYGTLGLAWTVAVGGVVALLGVMSPVLGVAYVLLGVVALAALAWRQRRLIFARWRKILTTLQRDRIFAALAVVAFSLVALRFILAIAPSSYIPLNEQFAGMRFNRHDDAHGYLGILERFMQTGRLGPDPFNFRLMTTSLGGLYFLQGLMLSGAWRDHLRVMDEGIGLVLLCGVALALGRRLAIPWRWRPLLVLVVLAPLILTMNLTSGLTAAAMLTFLATYAIGLPRIRGERWRAGAVIGLAASGLLALKTTFLPTVAILLGLVCLTMLIKQRRATVLWIMLIAAAVTGTLLLPWMINMHRMADTFWYPLLGVGYQSQRWGLVRDPITIEEWIRFGPGLIPPLAIIFVVTVILAWWRRFRAWPVMVLAIALLAWAVTVALILGSMGSHNVWRYAQPLTVAGWTLTTAVTLWAFRARRPRWRRWTRWVGVAGALLLLAYHIPGIYLQASVVVPANLRSVRANRPVYGEIENQRAAMIQSVVPPGEPILARLSLPFLLDFNRNPIYIPDWPGMASPPPGMPMFRGPQPLLEYLLALRIRYIAYSYANRAGFDHRVVLRTFEAGAGPWDRLMGKALIDFHENVESLGRSRRIIYDDGQVIVIDLAQAAEARAESPQ